jgi:benzoyl-CoA reductase subunit C
VGLFGGGDQVDIIRGDSYYQSYICHLPRSTLELALASHYDCLEGVVFPSICDVVRNLSGMWQMLFPDRWVGYLDLPQTFDPATGGRFYRQELSRLAAELAARGARVLTDDALRAAIADENRRRAALERLDALRREQPWRVPVSHAYVVARAGNLLTAAEHAGFVDAFVAAAARREAQPLDNVRVVLAGTFCEQPPLGLLRVLERAGCDIVDDDLQMGLRFIEGPIDEDARDPLGALVGAYLTRGSACAFRYIGDGDKGRALVERVRRAGADGVVFGAASFCDPALLDQPMLEAALEAEGIPHFGFKYAENTGQFQVIREQAGAFSDAVRLWEVT